MKERNPGALRFAAAGSLSQGVGKLLVSKSLALHGLFSYFSEDFWSQLGPVQSLPEIGNKVKNEIGPDLAAAGIQPEADYPLGIPRIAHSR
jgi:hypothetical protein